MDINRDELSQIKDILKNNPRGMTVTDISKEVKMNRHSVSKYLEMLVVSGHIDMRSLGPSKVYYLSQRLPVSAMLSLSSDLILILDSEMCIMNVNEAFLKFTGSKREDIINLNFNHFSFPLEFEPSIQPNIKDALFGSESTIEANYTKDDINYYFNVKFIPAVFDEGSKGATVIFEDITDKKRILQEIQENEQKFRGVIEQSSDGILLTDETGAIIEFNKAEESITGIKREDILGKKIWDAPFVIAAEEQEPERSRETVKGYVQLLLKTGKGPLVNNIRERNILRPDGMIRSIQVSVFPIRFEKGYKFCTINRDITEIKIAELALMESEERFRTLTQSTAAGILIFQDERLVYANPAAESIIGFPSNELQRLALMELLHPDFKGYFNTLSIDKVLGNLKAYRPDRKFQLRFFNSLREERWADFTIDKTLLKGSPAIIVTFYDITERKMAEEALAKSEAKYRELVENANSIILRMDMNGNIKFLNEFALRFFGYKAEELLGKNVMGTIVPEAPSTGLNVSWLIKQIQQKPDHYLHNENENMLRDGKLAWISWSNKGIVDDEGKVIEILCVGIDETERKQAETELKFSEEKFRALAESTTGGIIIAQGNKLAYANRAAADIMGYSMDELSDITLTQFAHPEHIIRRIYPPGDPDRHNDETAASTEIKFATKQGTERWIGVRVGRMKLKGQPASIITFFDITKQKHAEEAIKSAYDDLEHRVKERTMELQSLNDTLRSEISQRQQAEEKALEKSNELNAIIQAFPDLFFRLDKTGVILDLNTSDPRTLYKKPAEYIGNRMQDILPSKYRGPMALAIESINRGEPIASIEYKLSVKGKDEVFEARLLPALKDQIIMVVRNMTDRKVAENRLLKLNRALKMLNDCNQAMVHATDEHALLQSLCEIIANKGGGYQLVWVGYADNDARKTIRPVAKTGNEVGYLDSISLTWSDETSGNGPTGMAVKTGMTYVNRNVDQNKSFEPWLPLAKQYGFVSSISLPLNVQGRTIGALSIYSKYTDSFDEEEVKLLEQLASNLSYGITALRERADYAKKD